MHEGKPQKAKWWSRPRPQDPEGPRQQPETPDPAVGGDGDFELARPRTPAVDYELDRPAPAADAPGAGGGFGPVGGPAAPADERGGDSGDGRPGGSAPAGDARGGASGPEGSAPAEGAWDGGGGSGPEAAVAAADASGGADGSGPGGSASTTVGVRDGAGADEPGGRPAAAADARPRPLHEPDPYGTPPYGEPGPWAPAPPVQHPATTPAHGTAAPGTAPVHGATITGAAPAPASPAPVAEPSSDAPVPVVAPTHGGPAAGRAPVHGVAGAPAPAPGQSPAGAVPRQASAHGSEAPVGPPVSFGPGVAGGPGVPSAGSAPGGPGVPSVPGVPFTPGAAGAGDPWGRYDPWAQTAAGPLQQNGAAVPTENQRRGRRRRTLVVGSVLLAVVSGVAGGAVGAYLERTGGIGSVELPQAGKEPAERAPDSVAGIAAKALPSVVTLHVSGGGSGGTGTGFVLDDRGHILTNDHVVGPAGEGGEISVTFHSGDTAEATVVGRDSGYDLAVVKVGGVRGLTPMPLGNSDNVQVGDPVVAIGAPFDLAGTVTSGIISAKERPITAGGGEGDGSDVSYVDALQTDAPINPGNSGGPLLDAKGRAVGINSAIRSAGSGGDPDGGQAGSIGLGFAIPINQGKRVAEELINTGRATHPVIGITLDMGYSGDGARVGTEGSDGGPPVVAGGPGDRAGIEPGDVITAVDGRRVHSGEELIVKTRAHRPGDRLELTLERDGRERTVSLVLGSSHGG
ncbi:trypsin-like peptidase domain-containing protein [Streptomyces poriticola]|uniref:trypsin-like peptidase domain-containing protein n=1 Tax=Streptomyces poriticola TaxID=3120506 RepID=UPI002FCE1738